MSSDFDARLFARIAREDATPRWWQVVRWKPVVSLAAACAVLAVAFLVRLPHSGDARPDKVDIEQVEQTLDDLDILTPVT